MNLVGLFIIVMIFLNLIFAKTALSYVGPGAGFALISSFLILFITIILAFFTIFTWPFRAIVLSLKRRKVLQQSKIGRAVIVGLDGLDPGLCWEYMREGKMPHLQELAEKGTFQNLHTTTPAVSPVAWSTFATGVNPGKHRIFDFFTRDPQNYLPVLSSAHISNSTRTLKLGPWRIPLGKPMVKLLRRSTSFWTILGEKKIFSTVLRVPITFPPERFYGACLSAMCTPDLRGTQGTFTLFSSEKIDEGQGSLGGTTISLQLQGERFQTFIVGPSLEHNGSEKPLTIPMKGRVNYGQKTVKLEICKARYLLHEGRYSPWIKLTFKKGLRKRVQGLMKLLVTQIEPHLKIYMTPINIDPEKPAMPISYPIYYAIYLAKMHGPFATLGLAEDTSALNERVIDEGAFLEQAYDIYKERKKILIDVLKKTERGLLVSVFDTPDRIQHMFFRYLSPDHPANKGKDTTRYKNAVEQVYMKMDELIGEVRQLLDEQDLLMVVSDHGFRPFKWGINLNSWLRKEGYLALKEGASSGDEWFANVDWSETRAYALGLAGIFINTRGREAAGIVNPGEEKLTLQREIRKKLVSLRNGNEKNREKPIRKVLTAHELYHGPYVSEAPDLFIGFNAGYRASWNSAIGKVTGEIFEDNTRSWSGDHSIDPELIPGVFFCNWRFGGKPPSLQDIAPTILNLFGMEKPGFQDGRILELVPQGH